MTHLLRRVADSDSYKLLWVAVMGDIALGPRIAHCLREVTMRSVYFLVLMAGLSISSGFARQKWTAQSATLKVRQKRELWALKLKEQYAKSSLEDSDLQKAVRIQLKHQLKREQRKLRQRQKDERQTLKDRQKLLKLEMKELQSE